MFEKREWHFLGRIIINNEPTTQCPVHALFKVYAHLPSPPKAPKCWNWVWSLIFASNVLTNYIALLIRYHNLTVFRQVVKKWHHYSIKAVELVWPKTKTVFHDTTWALYRTSNQQFLSDPLITVWLTSGYVCSRWNKTQKRSCKDTSCFIERELLPSLVNILT